MQLNTFRWFDDTSIGIRLGVGFGLILLILVGYGIFSIREMQVLSALGDAIYEHPMDDHAQHPRAGGGTERGSRPGVRR